MFVVSIGFVLITGFDRVYSSFFGWRGGLSGLQGLEGLQSFGRVFIGG